MSVKFRVLLVGLVLTFALSLPAVSGTVPLAAEHLPPLGGPQGAALAAWRSSAGVEVIPAPPYRVIIPAVGVNTMVVEAPRTPVSWDVSHLTWQVGHLEGTAFPGQGSNVVLGGHRYLGASNGQPSQPGPFVALDRLQRGDQIQVYAGSSVYTYEVTRQLRVAPGDVWVVNPTNVEMLTLLTCDTWNPQTQTFERRLVVRARLSEARPIE